MKEQTDNRVSEQRAVPPMRGRFEVLSGALEHAERARELGQALGRRAASPGAATYSTSSTAAGERNLRESGLGGRIETVPGGVSR